MYAHICAHNAGVMHTAAPKCVRQCRYAEHELDVADSSDHVTSTTCRLAKPGLVFFALYGAQPGALLYRVHYRVHCTKG